MRVTHRPEQAGGRSRVPAGPVTRRLPALTGAAAPWVLPAALLLAVGLAGVRRAGGLDALGLSGDEAVYVGQGRAIRDGLVPEVRAHSPLLGLLLRLVPDGTTGEVVPRATSVVLGLVAVVVAGLLGAELAGRAAGAVAALVVATMAYHADVTRLVLVEVPMATAVAVALLLAVRSVRLGRPRLVEGAAVAMGVATLFKETAVLSAVALVAAVLVGGLPAPRRVLGRAAGWYVLVVSAYPVHLALTGGLPAATGYLRWQLARAVPGGPGYLEAVLPRIGWVVLVAAAVGVVAVLVRDRPGGAAVVLAVAVPATFYAVWPVTSYPYLLALVVPLAALAGVGVDAVARVAATTRGRVAGAVALVATAVVTGATPATGAAPELPGASGVPAVREAAGWVGGASDAPVVTAAPWVATVVRTYVPGRPVSSVRPVTTPADLLNPADRARTVSALPGSAVVVVWDAWTASRDPVAATHLLTEVRARGGRVAHVESRPTSAGSRPLVVVYLVPAVAGGAP